MVPTDEWYRIGPSSVIFNHSLFSKVETSVKERRLQPRILCFYYYYFIIVCIVLVVKGFIDNTRITSPQQRIECHASLICLIHTTHCTYLLRKSLEGPSCIPNYFCAILFCRQFQKRCFGHCSLQAWEDDTFVPPAQGVQAVITFRDQQLTAPYTVTAFQLLGAEPKRHSVHFNHMNWRFLSESRCRCDTEDNNTCIVLHHRISCLIRSACKSSIQFPHGKLKVCSLNGRKVCKRERKAHLPCLGLTCLQTVCTVPSLLDYRFGLTFW